MMLPTVCFFIGMAMMACTIVGYACIRVGAMSEYEEMLSRERGKTAGDQGGVIGQNVCPQSYAFPR